MSYLSQLCGEKGGREEPQTVETTHPTDDHSPPFPSCAWPCELYRSGCSKTYTVKSGDTCNSIAQANGLTPWQTLISGNPSANINSQCTNLQIGQILCVSGFTPTPTSTQTGGLFYCMFANMVMCAQCIIIVRLLLPTATI